MPLPSTASTQHTCPCRQGSKKILHYTECCQPHHLGTPASTAEALMRSRYSAYVLGLSDYLSATWHPTTRPTQVSMFDHQWLGLKIIATSTLTHEQAMVEFIARFKVNGKAQVLHERSQFKQQNGLWYYTTGEHIDST